MARLVGDLQFDPEVLRYAERRTASAFEAFEDLHTVDILLGGGNGSVTCRLHIAFVRGRAVIVGHSGSTILHAIDTAIETAAHIVRSQADRQR